MSVQYDPYLVGALAREVEAGWGGGRGTGLRLLPAARAGELRFADRPALLFLLHPREGFLVASSEPVTRGPGPTFRRLWLARAWAPPDERVLLLSLADAGGRERYRIAVELATNRRNLLLLEVGAEGRESAEAGEGTEAEESGGERTPLRIRACLRERPDGPRPLRRGSEYPELRSPRRWATSPPTLEEWVERFAGVEPGARRSAVLREVAYLSPINVEAILGEALAGEAAEGEAAEGETVPGEARIGEARLREAGERYLRLRRHVEAAVAGRPAEGRPGGERAATGGPREGGGSAAAGPGKGGGSGAGEPEAVQAAGGSAAVRSGGAWLLNRPWGPQPYPSALEEPDARPRPSLLEAMAAAGAREAVARLATRPLVRSGKRPTAPGSAGTCPSPSPGGDPARADEEVERLRRALGRRRERLGKRRAALRRELEKGPAPEELRETGHLLLARLPEIPRGAAAVTLEGFDGSPRTVELDPALPAAANAERLFREAARRERAAKRLPPQLARVEAELARVEEALGSLEEEGPTERLREAAGGSPPSTPTPKVGTRLPYLRLRSSGGLEIRVGRGARANDELTLHHSAPEDIWLHAHQVRGAHVILRWGRREENPPRQDLLEAAIVAAVHSRARHSGTVAVDWTRRKYVRKPRKAPPGAVRAERVKTVFAEPNAGLVERLKIRATREER